MKKLQLLVTTTAILGIFSLSGCASKAENGALIGAGSGALIGQAIGKNTASTVIGAGVGAIVGATIGENEDRKDAQYYRY